jgi:hypothetical protein
MKKSCNAFSKSAVWALIVGATPVLGGCGGETPTVKTEALPPTPAVTAPPPKLSAAEKAALKKKQLTEDEPSAQERRAARLKAKKVE